MLSGSKRIGRNDNRFDKRKRSRTPIGLNGKLLVPDRGFEDRCVVLDMSPIGAGVKSSITASIGTHVVLYVDPFGRFEGTVVERYRTRLGIQFNSGINKQDRTNEQLANYAVNGITDRQIFRSALRWKKFPSFQQFTTSDGHKFDCEVFDIAMGGASFKTDARPKVGELIDFGGTSGRVVRHTEQGIAVAFLGGHTVSHSQANALTDTLQFDRSESGR